MVYQHPLAYLLGLEGAALLRVFAGDYDREFGEARIGEIRRLLDSPEFDDGGVEAPWISTVEGYEVWSRTYDEPGNGLFPIEEPIIHEILGGLSPGAALDAACGTGRQAEYLSAAGHQVTGVDSSPDMLEHARLRVPDADFRLGELTRLPVPDDHFDIAVCSLALTHIRDLKPVFAEFARVLRPGGHLVTTDAHQELVAVGSVPRVRSADGDPGFIPSYRHRASDYLAAALPVGLQVRRCEEPRQPGRDQNNDENAMAWPVEVGPWDGWPWSLHGIAPAAAGAVWSGMPIEIIWHFRRA